MLDDISSLGARGKPYPLILRKTQQVYGQNSDVNFSPGADPGSDPGAALNKFLHRVPPTDNVRATAGCCSSLHVGLGPGSGPAWCPLEFHGETRPPGVLGPGEVPSHGPRHLLTQCQIVRLPSILILHILIYKILIINLHFMISLMLS